MIIQLLPERIDGKTASLVWAVYRQRPIQPLP
jgi:hypothetical protein